ncbi:hypothetical protein NFX46_16900 [Streptomyces phaeoluteigriseus]|uniref:Uncharacterized protein n=1 Tax=Streptomyces phaeoluteigriseus TaxID=114686 RepID=A0ABY4Z9W6_9ACTN|nr:hypothetical protein [Streptomyces phaeoluteigriseus]USQ85310.1 hypothetical protein NFX46_16900 [Streptomyces phaeoluteigriseus]
MAIFGRPAASYVHPGRLDIFVRSREATLVHLWLADGVPGALDLGGWVDRFSEPVAVHRDPEGLDVFAVAGLKLLHWRWDAARGRMIGPEELPGYLATRPVPVADGDSLFVFAADLGGRLRIWESRQDGPWSYNTRTDVDTAGLIAVRRQPGTIDTYALPSGIVHRALVNGQWQEPVLLPQSDTLEPGVVSVAAIAWPDEHHVVRRDVYGRLGDGGLRHWGRGFFSSPHPTRWWGPDRTRPERPPFEAAVAARGPDIFFRDAEGLLHHWIWQHRDRRWDDFSPVTDGWTADPVTVERGGEPAGVDVVAQVTAGRVRVASWDTRSWTHLDLELPSSRDASGAVAPEPAQDALAGTTDDVPPAFLLTRPADHVVLGVQAVGYRMTDEPVPRLVAETGDAHLVMTFPPQHIAEEVSGPGAAALFGDVWQARLAGSSRIAVTAAPEFELTAAGVLAALHDAPIDPDARRTAVELPWGLIVAPRPGPGAVVTRHPSEPVVLDGTTGLWRTRFGTDAGDGGVAVAALRAGRPDPFPVALTKANRVNITGQAPPARADRLELSSLGGTLIAAGNWRALEWEQRTVGGRDQRVRTATKGVLYPFGHRAVFVETTERSPHEPVAVLRKTRMLYVTESTADALESRAFPFQQVELTTLEFGGLDDAHWRTVPRPTREIAELENQALQAEIEADRIFDDLYGPDALLAGMPRVEELAAGLTDDADELLDPEDPEGPTRAGAAHSWLHLDTALRDVRRAIALLQQEDLGTERVETFFLPTRDGSPIRFPVRCRQPGHQVGFDLPLVFVADLELGDEVRSTFRSLNNPEVTERVHRFYTQSGHGTVDLPGAKINMVLDETRTAPGDVQEVYRLNIAGSQSPGGGFIPSLGRPGEPGSWAAEVALPTLRTMLDSDPRVRTVFDQAYLDATSDDIPLRILDQLPVDFTVKADRSGGLAAPKFLADGISRVQGLVNVAGSQSLAPADLFTQGASLFGFDLRDLVRDITAPPELVTLDTTPPEVRLSWEDIPLAEAPGGEFLPQSAQTSRLTLRNTSSPARNETTCVITDFTLVLPPSEPMIEISFGRVEFRQLTGEAPHLSIDGLRATFVGKLRLLDVLQEKVGLGGLAPRIELSAKDITARYAMPVPDVAAFSFVLSNLGFTAGLRVPFDGRPVSMSLGFASRARPFTLTVLMFGGGGYLDLELDRSGLRRLEVSLQFGAAVAINLGVATAEVHAFGGIRYELAAGAPRLTGFIHIGGSVELLGLVSVSVELQVELAYQFDTNALVGRAKVVVEIDVTLFSESIELDSGEWVIAGGSAREGSRPLPGPMRLAAPPPEPDPDALAAWRRYRGAFA